MATLEIQPPGGPARKVELVENSYTIGRDSACKLAFPEDNELSRQHLSIERSGYGWMLRDLNSRNGCYVNGDRVTVPRMLVRGDSIKAGKLRISYLEGERPSVVFEKNAGAQQATVVISLRDLLGETGQMAVPGAVAKPKQWTSPVQALLRAGRELVAGRPLPELFQVILDMAIEASGAERGVLMTLENGELVEQAKSEGEFRISSMVRDRVIQDRESLLIHDALGDALLQHRQSIVLQKVQTLMAVPLQTEDRVIGLIYVDARSLQRSFGPDDLNLLTVMANVAAIRIERVRLAQVERDEERHRMELEQAARIQRLSLPERAPEVPGYAIAGRSVPCFAVGGDYYDYYRLADGRVMILIGDVAGKGMPAALLVMSLQANASALAMGASGSAVFTGLLNHAIHPRCPRDRFVTFFVCILDPVSGEVEYCSAGHNPPLVVRADGAVERLERGGLVLGILKNVAYTARTVRLAAGDQLVLYTDGITEAESPAGEEFDLPYFEAFLQANTQLGAEALLDAILARVDGWTNGAPPSDDRTLVCVQREG